VIRYHSYYFTKFIIRLLHSDTARYNRWKFMYLLIL